MVEWTDSRTTGNCVLHNAHVQGSSQVPYVWEHIETLKCILFYCNYAASFTHNMQLFQAHVGKQISLMFFYVLWTHMVKQNVYKCNIGHGQY